MSSEKRANQVVRDMLLGLPAVVPRDLLDAPLVSGRNGGRFPMDLEKALPVVVFARLDDATPPRAIRILQTVEHLGASRIGWASRFGRASLHSERKFT